jgi:hypothetical protein
LNAERMDHQVARNAANAEIRRLSGILEECRTVADLRAFETAVRASPCFDPDEDGVRSDDNALGPWEHPSAGASVRWEPGRHTIRLPGSLARAQWTAARGWEACR